MTEGITFVVPVRDEASTVEAALESLAAQTVGPESLEVLVFDGRSTDGTTERCRAVGARHAWLRFEVHDNPEATVPYALVEGLRRARCPWLSRLDGRARLSPAYVEVCLRRLAELPPLSAVGGRLVAEAEGTIPASIAAAVTHPLGVGRGFRTARRNVELPHHPFAVWRTDDVRRLGGFDLRLVRNQDDEFSMRARARGARILLEPEAQVAYRPRERFRGLGAQYFQYGLWKSAVAVRTGLFPARALAPAAVTLALAGAVGLGVSDRTRIPLGALAAFYLAGGAMAARRLPAASSPVTAAALATVHSAYGAGVLAGFLCPQLAEGRLGTGRLR
jgi:hypothetical protein